MLTAIWYELELAHSYIKPSIFKSIKGKTGNVECASIDGNALFCHLIVAFTIF